MHGIPNNFSLVIGDELVALEDGWQCAICIGGKDDPSSYGAQRTAIIRHLASSSSAEAPVYHYEHADCMLEVAARAGHLWRCSQRCAQQTTLREIRTLAPVALPAEIRGRFWGVWDKAVETFPEFKQRTFSKGAFQNIALISAVFAALTALSSPFFSVAFASVFLTIASGASIAWVLPKTISWLVDIATAQVGMGLTARVMMRTAAFLFSGMLITPHLTGFFAKQLLSPLLQRIASAALNCPWASALSEFPIPLGELCIASANVTTRVSFVKTAWTPEELWPIG